MFSVVLRARSLLLVIRRSKASEEKKKVKFSSQECVENPPIFSLLSLSLSLKLPIDFRSLFLSCLFSPASCAHLVIYRIQLIFLSVECWLASGSGGEGGHCFCFSEKSS